MKIAVVIGSIRENRNGLAVGEWIFDFATKRNDEGISYTLVDLKDYNLPLLGSSVSSEQQEIIKNWSETMASFDGYIFITPEYNRVITGAMKNALDYLQPELHNKAAGLVGYGGLGGLSAIQSLRLILSEQEVATVRTMVTFSIMADFVEMSKFNPHGYHDNNVNKMLDQLINWTKALKTIR